MRIVCALAFSLLCYGFVRAHEIPVYWINLNEAVARKTAMEIHLSNYGFAYHRRIGALTKNTCNAIMIDSTCNRVTLDDIAILCSHVFALYTALTDSSPQAIKSKYFIVLEDDIKFNMAIDFNQLIKSAPSGFGMLQLMMSHKLHIESHWSEFLSTNATFSYRPRNSTVWSAQAIIYNKEAIRPFIESAVRKDRKGNLGFKLVNTFDYVKYSSYAVNRFRPSIASDCMFADFFLYSMGQPAYILNVPVVSSARTGLNSSYHQSHVLYHIHGYSKIEEIQQLMRSGKVTHLPSFIDLPRSVSFARDAAAGNDINWSDLARNNPVSVNVPVREQ